MKTNKFRDKIITVIVVALILSIPAIVFGVNRLNEHLVEVQREQRLIAAEAEFIHSMNLYAAMRLGGNLICEATLQVYCQVAFVMFPPQDIVI